ncbi:MAG: DUF4157 domain-containing protein [Anaerolineae bacterium]|nr:DUF4157 domain-containing protein [Anaerolineae bacterium]
MIQNAAHVRQQTQTAVRISSLDASAGSNGVAIAPPAYGIDIVDHQSVGLESEDKQAEPSLASTIWPAQSHPIQRKSGTTEANSGAFGPNRPNKTGLPDKLKVGIETLSGYALDDVKVHYNSAKPAQLQALAYTQGTDIHVGPGQERHVPHEAWHVVQQKQGRVKPTLQAKGVNINDDPWLEAEADRMSRHAVLYQGPVQAKKVPTRE